MAFLRTHPAPPHHGNASTHPESPHRLRGVDLGDLREPSVSRLFKIAQTGETPATYHNEAGPHPAPTIETPDDLTPLPPSGVSLFLAPAVTPAAILTSDLKGPRAR